MDEEILGIEESEALFNEIADDGDGQSNELLDGEADLGQVGDEDDGNELDDGSEQLNVEPNGDGQEVDIWADVPEPARQQFESLQQQFNQVQHSESSNRSRVSALQKKLNTLEAQAKPQPQPEAEQDGAKAELSPELEDAMELYGGDIGLVVNHLLQQELGKALTPLQQEAVALKEMVSPVIAKQQEQEFAERKKELEQQHEDASRIEADPAFWDWVDASRKRQEMSESPNPAVVAELLSNYKQVKPTESTKPKRDLSKHVAIKGSGSTKAERLGDTVADPEAYFDSI